MVDAENNLKRMIHAGMRPDDALYTAVIDGFCKMGDLRKGSRLLQEMQKGGRVPAVATYNALMNGLCKQGNMKKA
ncbi:pentatricopeptide repeat-containing protein, partial [Klebsiella pneumoniae]